MVKKNTLAIYVGVLGIFSPFLAYAQTQENFIVQVVTMLEAVVTALFPIVVTLAIIAFAYNIGRYLSSKDLADQSVFKAGIINSFYALFIIFTVFGTVKILAQTLGIPSLAESITIANESGLGGNGGKNFRDYAFIVARFLSQRVVPLMISGAVLVFFSNIAISMTKSDSETERTNLNAYLRWGVLAILILLTLFSIVNLFTGTFFGTQAFIPQFPTS